jgi:alpha-ketoglutarate-dependent taurine dioxygenase
MKQISVINNSSFQEFLQTSEKHVNSLKELGAIVLRGHRFSREEQLIVTQIFGNHLGYYPNLSSMQYWHYQENHRLSLGRRPGCGKQDILVPWHLEHFGYPNPAIGATWNMEKFTCDSDAGATIFVDTSDVFELLGDKQKEFLRSCKISALPNFDDPISPTEPTILDVVQTHKLSNKEILRISFCQKWETDTNCRLIQFGGRTPTDQEIAMFHWYESWVGEQVTSNTNVRQIHHWESGDLLIVDLMVMYHAVLGGFSETERFFNGFWMHQYDTSKYGN